VQPIEAAAAAVSHENIQSAGLSLTTGSLQATQTARFIGAHLSWPVERPARTFVVRVVEPREYEPSQHAQLFNAVLTELISPAEEPIDPFNHSTTQPQPGHFDLITFPEAFVYKETLLEALNGIANYGPLGCIHVGLRGSTNPKCHLFTVKELIELVNQLTLLSDIVAADIAIFREWVGHQNSCHVFNVACVFVVDAERRLRVCLHPKIIRSQFETSPLPEQHMGEADLLTLISLCPTDKRYFSVTLQPLICSDLLKLSADRVDCGPMEAVNRFADCFGDQPPDHIDVVSVATCTPQPEGKAGDGSVFRLWHEQFYDAFKGAAQDPNLTRHHFSALVLSNFKTLTGGQAGGLSGVFLPVPPKYAHFHNDVVVSCWGQPTGESLGNRWSRPDDNPLANWKTRGFVASLDPFAAPIGAQVKIFGFTIQRLPRDNSLWAKPESLTECHVRVGRFNDAAELTFHLIGPRQ
jgi:hypothetical protein